MQTSISKQVWEVRANYGPSISGCCFSQPAIEIDRNRLSSPNRQKFEIEICCLCTGSHFDFASFVASYAIGSDWKELFDIVIFFARKPSFFHSTTNRPFWRLDGPNEVERCTEGWEDLESGEYYSQGNWKDLNEFLEYCTEWEPTTCLYFGDNVLQDVLAPKKVL